MRTAIVLVALVLAGCGSLPLMPDDPPEVSDTLRTYERDEYTAAEPIALPSWQISGITTVSGERVAFLTDEHLARLEAYIEAAEANTEALAARTSECRALHQEADALLYAGQQSELQAELFRQLYRNESRWGRVTNIAMTGALGVLMLSLAL